MQGLCQWSSKRVPVLVIEKCTTRGIPGLAVAFLEAFHSVAVSFDVYDPAVMKQAVEHGGGDHGIPEHLLPFREALV